MKPFIILVICVDSMQWGLLLLFRANILEDMSSLSIEMLNPHEFSCDNKDRTRTKRKIRKKKKRKSKNTIQYNTIQYLFGPLKFGYSFSPRHCCSDGSLRRSVLRHKKQGMSLRVLPLLALTSLPALALFSKFKSSLLHSNMHWDSCATNVTQQMTHKVPCIQVDDKLFPS